MNRRLLPAVLSMLALVVLMAPMAPARATASNKELEARADELAARLATLEQHVPE